MLSSWSFVRFVDLFSGMLIHEMHETEQKEIKTKKEAVFSDSLGGYLNVDRSHYSFVCRRAVH